MGRIEVITRTERRRKYSPAEREAIMREADAPDVTVREVAKRHDIAESLIYSWRTARRQAEKIASEPLTFISYGTVPQADLVAVPPASPPARPTSAPAMPVMAEELTRPHPGARPGGAHARRKLHDVYKADPHSVAAEGLKLIRELYDVERGIACDPADNRRKARTLSRLRALDFFAWADGVLAQISARSSLAEALRYAVKLKPQLLAYTEDGRLEIDNNLAENALRGIAVGRKNWLFAGADCGGERAASIYSLLETAKLNDVNPQAWLADVLARIGKGHPINRVDELLPWEWSA